MSVRSLLYVFLAIFLLGDLVIVFFVYQKYTAAPQINSQTFLTVNGQELRTFLNQDPPLPEIETADFQTPFFEDDVELSDFEQNGDDFFAMIEGTDEHLEMSGKLDGSSSSIEDMSAVLTVFTGSYDHDNFAASRISGTFEMEETPSYSVLAGEMNIGRIMWAKLPLGGIKVTLQGTPLRGDLEMRGKVSGHRGTVFEAEAQLMNKRITDLHGTLNVAYPDEFQTFLNTIRPETSIDFTGGSTLEFRQLGQEMHFYYPEEPKNPVFVLQLAEKKTREAERAEEN